MNLVMFDIDGTLTATTDIDEQCFIRAVNEVLQVYDLDTDVSNYTHVTDEGIAAEIIRRYTSDPVTEEKLCDIRRCFLRLLRVEAASEPDSIRQVPGAAEILNALDRSPDHAISLATGGWRESALFKIRNAGFDLTCVPMATSDDSIKREEIMRISEKRACRAYDVDAFESVVFIGDGIWDLRAGDTLGYGFIGIAAGDRAFRLMHEGAAHVISDFLNREAFFEILKIQQKRP
jgi:phosphoglycolate phosphatase-like HAD superfamily hydrolase